MLDKISAAQDSLWRAELTRRVLILVIASMVVGLGWLVMDQWIWSPGVWGRTIVAAVLLAAVAAYAYLRLWPVVHLRIREDYAARALERDHPELGHALSSYVSLRQQRANHPRGQLAQRVVQSVGANAAAKLKHIDAPPSEATGLISWWVTAIALLALLAIYALASPKNSAQSVARLVRPLANLDAPRRVQITDVTPGDTETLAGRSLEIGATVKNLGDEEPVYFRWDTPQSELVDAGNPGSPADTQGETSPTQTQLLLSNADGDLDRYVATIPISHHAKGTRRYHIVAGDASVGPYEVSIRDTPVVQVREVIYSPPAYTGKTKHTSHTGSIQGVDGTKVELVASVNRPITRAIIEFNPRKVGQDLQATAGASEMQIAGDGMSVRFAFPLRSRKGGAIELQDYRIRVWDDVGQTNADPIVYPIRVIEDLPPEITIVVPQQSVKDVPIDSEQVFEIHAADVDYGLAEVEIEIHRGIDLIARSTLWKEPAGKLGNQVIEYRFRPSRMIVVARDGGIRARRGGGLIVGDEVEVVAIATDNRTDPNDATIVPGVTRTEPVRLRITAATSPNNQPTNEPDQPQGDRDSSKQQGGGQSDDGQQGGSGGGQSGEGQQGEGQQGEGQQGEGQQGEGQQGEGQQGEGQQGEGQQGGDSQGQNQSGDSNSDDSSDAGSEMTESGGEDSGSDASDNGGSSKGQPSNDGKNTPSENDRSDSNDSPPSENSDAQSSQGNNANASENNRSGKPNGGDPSNAADDTPQTPPQDDAEAFERIQDYLNEKRNNPSQNQDNGNRDSSRQPNDDRNQNGGNSGEQSNQQQLNDSGNESESTEGQGNDNNDASGEQSRDGNPPRGQDPNENASESSNKSDQPSGDNSRDPSMNNQDGPQSQNQNQSQNENTQNDAARDNENSASDQSSSDQSSSDQSSSDGASGDQASDNQSGDGRSDDSQTGESERTEESGKENSSESGKGSEDGNDEQGSNSDSDQDTNADTPSGQNRDSQSGSRDADPSRSDDSGASENQDGSPQNDSGSDSPSGEHPDSQPGQNGESQSQPDGSPSDSQSGDPQEQNPNQDPGNSDMPASNANSSNQSSDSPGEPSPFDQNPSSDSSQGGGSGQSGGGVGEEVPAENELPDPVDMEYTKAATDMVLDYLDETRTDPDPELLERLKWTEQDLRRFRQRWQDIKPIDGAPPTDAPAADEIEEALRSLGMRPPGNTQSNRRDRADDIRGLRDSGNRRPAPANIRDAFDAFRRGISRD
ncbi:circumsporozoite protein-putative membrane associated protein [Rhodopirellula sallentina SM41]|uniref:Circumsporozoite protein-putative membrane associated protein n=1 Tax=Rhodopirellula sallentina SM41 TaxID=1263870 RepID=M5TU58_9BACT|nr:circumsporozoite protein-putative membrane associated protein [Rhodopirellula sallentina SM41]